jgi:hypothetical protein
MIQNKVKSSIAMVRFLAVTVVLLNCATTFADTTNLVDIGESKSGKQKIITIFPDDTILTKQEIVQVINLAKQNGLTNANEVGVFHFIPGGGKGITVKSAELHEGRNTRFDTVYIYKAGWSGMETNSKSMVNGKFWSDKDGNISTLLRDYKSTNGAIFQVAIGKDVDFAIADKLVDYYHSNKLLPTQEKSKDGVRIVYFGMEIPQNAHPKIIRRDDSRKYYEMEFDNYPTTVVKLRIEKEEIEIIGISEYVI